MRIPSLLLLLGLLVGCQRDEAPATAVEQPVPAPAPSERSTQQPDAAAAIGAALSHPDRLENDLERDALRKPAEVLRFAGIQPGMKVLDLFAASGWYTEILSRVVGANGEVWAQNPPEFYERYGSADLDFRLADRRLPNVERQDRPMQDLALPDAYFDAVTAVLVFHDLFWITDDVSAVLTQLHAAMKPGAVILIVDHEAPEGSGATLASGETNRHRVESELVRQMMQATGFEPVAESAVLRNEEDDHTLAFFDPGMRGKPTDRFVHLYRKPGD